MRNACTVLAGEPRGKPPLGGVGVDERIIIKLISKRQDMRTEFV
jgi:hypothetical protein